ncbi:MAG: terminase small subunit [Clostridia bacterium]|nr:terminase small subunit [Clostridia bacterium]
MTDGVRDQPGDTSPPVATPDEVLETFTRIMRGEVTDTVIRKGKGGEETVQVPPKVSERCKAAELLGKRFGLFTEKDQAAVPRDETARAISQALEKLIRERGNGSDRA